MNFENSGDITEYMYALEGYNDELQIQKQPIASSTQLPGNGFNDLFSL